MYSLQELVIKECTSQLVLDFFPRQDSFLARGQTARLESPAPGLQGRYGHLWALLRL